METEFAVSLGSQRWTLPADGDTITIGRGSNADIRLPSDDQISRIHARLNRSGTTWALVDESRNGTALNGRRLAAPTPLTDNDRIQIGRSVLTFHEPTTADPDGRAGAPQAPLSGRQDGAAAAAGSAGAASAAGSAAAAAGLATGAAAAGSAGSTSPTSAPPSGSAPSGAGLAAGGPSSAPPPPPAPRRPAASAPSSAGAGDPASASGLAASGSSPTPPPAHRPSAPSPQAAPGATPDRAAPGATPAQAAPGGTPAQARSGATPAAGGPGAAPTHTTPGTTPAPGGPGAGPAHTGPGTTPAQAGPGGTPAQAGPGAQAGPAAQAGSGGTPGTHAQGGAGGVAAGAGAQAGSGGSAGAPASSSPEDTAGNSPFRDGASGFDAGTPVDSTPFWSEPTPGTPDDGASQPGWLDQGGEDTAAGRANTDQGAADSHAARAGQEAPRDGSSLNWPQSDPDFHDQIIGGSQPSDLPDAEHPDAGSDEWIGGAQVGWVDPADAGSGGAAWAAYPSADNPEPARSPWSTTKRPALTQPEGGQANWAESAGWPDSAFEKQEPASPPTPEPEPVRRKPEATEDAPAGHVRLIRVLLVAAAVLGLGLVINLVATFFADGAGGTLQWLVPPAIALIAAMVVALLDAVSSEDRPAGGRLDVPVIVAIVAVLLGVGVGGFALTAGVEYVAGYVTGKESGEDRLIKPVAKTTAGLTITVENVTYTSHFTRVEVAVSNGGDQSLSLPLEGNAAFTGADGNSLKADGFRSQWNDSIAAGSVEHGTITFKGHLPEGLTDATLTLKSGDAGITVPGLALSN